jgi:hypothetical protein
MKAQAVELIEIKLKSLESELVNYIKELNEMKLKNSAVKSMNEVSKEKAKSSFEKVLNLWPEFTLLQSKIFGVKSNIETLNELKEKIVRLE